MDKPTVGRTVHFSDIITGKCRAAIISDVHNSESVDLTVFEPEMPVYRTNVPYQEPSPVVGLIGKGTWHWPERA